MMRIKVLCGLKMAFKSFSDSVGILVRKWANLSIETQMSFNHLKISLLYEKGAAGGYPSYNILMTRTRVTITTLYKCLDNAEYWKSYFSPCPLRPLLFVMN